MQTAEEVQPLMAPLNAAPLPVKKAFTDSGEVVLVPHKIQDRAFTLRPYSTRSTTLRQKIAKYQQVVKSRMTKDNMIMLSLFVGMFVMYIIAFIFTVREWIAEERIRSSYQRSIPREEVTFYFNGSEVLHINGTATLDFETKTAKFEVTFPSYKIMWRSNDQRTIPEPMVWIDVKPAGGQPVTKAKKEIHNCPGEEKWCLPMVTNCIMRNPIRLTYLLMYSAKIFEFETINFDRVFYVHWDFRKKLEGNTSRPLLAEDVLREQAALRERAALRKRARSVL